MKKSSLQKKMVSYFCMGGVFICMILTACENFLEGSAVKKELQEQIDYASMQKYDVEVSLPGYETDLLTEYGEISAEGNKELLVGDTFTIFFLMNSKYEFVKYYVYDKTSRKQCYDALSFKTIISANENTVTIQTTAKLLKPADSLLIIPECNLVNDYEKPELNSIQAAATAEYLQNNSFFINQWRYKGTAENINEDYFNNHTGKSVFIYLNVSDESPIKSVQIGERIISGESDYSDRDEKHYTFYDCPFDYTFKKESGWDKLNYDIMISDYYIHKTDGPVELAVKLTDSCGNIITSIGNDYNCVTVIKDSKCSSEYYLSNSDIYNNLYSQEVTEALSKRNIDGSIDMTLNFYARPEKYLDFASDRWDELKWEYAASQDYESLESIQLQEFIPVFTDSQEAVKKASNTLTVHINNPEKAAYIKFKKTDSAGNTALKYFYIPAVPKITDHKFTYFNGSQKYLYVSALLGDINKSEHINQLIHCVYSYKRDYLNGTIDSLWRRTEKADIYGSATLGVHQYNAGDHGFSQANEAQYYTCTANNELISSSEEYRIYSALTEVQTVPLLSELTSMPLITFNQSNVSFSAGEENMQIVTVTLDPEEISLYKSFCLKYPVITEHGPTLACGFFEGSEFSFTIKTEYFADNQLDLQLMAFSDTGMPSYYDLQDFNANYIDNIRPSCKTMMHYPHGYLIFDTKDIGSGLDEYKSSLKVLNKPYYTDNGKLDGQEIVSEFKKYYISRTENGNNVTKLCIDVYNNIHRIPYTIAFDIYDTAGNKTEFILPYELPQLKNREAYSLSNSGDNFTFTIISAEDNQSKEDYPVSWDIIGPENKWIKGNHWITQEEPAGDGKTISINDSIKNIPADSRGFLRIFAADSRPLYFWNKGIQKAEIADIIENSRGIHIYSDVPFYVHTLWSRVNWGNDVDKWENFSVLGVQENNQNAEVEGTTEVKIECHIDKYITTPYYYSFPVPDEEAGIDLKGLYYYTTIVHFADGTSLMSTVKSKNPQ